MSEWREEILVDCLDSLIDYRGKTPKKSDKGIVTLSAKSVKTGKIDYSQAYYISLEEYKKFMVRGFPQKGDILMTTEAPLGCIAKLDRDNISVAQRLLALRGKKNILDNSYLMYYLMSRRGQYELLSRASGSTVQGISRLEFKNVLIILPELSEQKQIAKTLSTLDEKITLLRAQNHTLEALAQTLFKQWFVAFEFPNENGQPYKSSGGLMVESELGEIPEGWGVGTIQDLTIKMASGGTPLTKNASYYGGGVNWFSTKELKDNFLIESEKTITVDGLENSSAKLFPNHTVLMAIYAAPTVGRLGILCKEATFNQATVGFVSKPQVGYEFVYLLLKSLRTQFNNLANGAAQQNLNVGLVKQFKILLPDSVFQQNLKNILYPIFLSMENNTNEIQTLTQLRDVLLPKLMSGELRVNE